MGPAEIVKQTWQALVARLTVRFNADGYQVVRQQHTDLVFGSCYVEWSNNEDVLRLTWDGKECWFVLEEAMLPVNMWTEIMIAPFEPGKQDALNAALVIDQVMGSLD